MGNIRIIRTKDYKSMSRAAANVISAQMILKPDCVLGLATGSTPEGIYDQLVEWYEKGDLDFAQIKAVNLDEYKGLSADNPQSYAYFMNEHLFSRVNINMGNTHIENGLNNDAEIECENYEKLIRTLGGIDLQLLGLGRNGHIGFNEPADSFALKIIPSFFPFSGLLQSQKIFLRRRRGNTSKNAFLILPMMSPAKRIRWALGQSCKQRKS